MNRVAVTGMGLVDTLGNNPDMCFDNYLNKEHYPEPYKYEDSIVSHLKCFYADHELMIPDNIKSSIYNSLHKINKMGLHSVEQALKNVPKSSNVAVVYSTVTASAEGYISYHDYCVHGGKKLRPRQLIQGTKDFLVGLIPQIYDFHGITTSMYAACSTTLYNIDYAIRILDDYDYVVVGGADVGTELTELIYFNELGAIGTKSSPYDRDRDGFIMGEGAGCIILEREDKAKARGAKIYGYIHSIGMGNDGSAGSATAPDLNCSGIKRAITNATKDFPIECITFVNAHGTSTPIGDELEYHAIQEVLGDIDVVSFKSKIGHTMGASGIIEIIYTLQAMRNGVVPPNHNINNPIDELVNIPTETKSDIGEFALKNSLAFGGKNVSVLLQGN